MKIDLHVHTKQCKKGDGEARNVSSALFKEKIQLAGISVLAITNHNHFDLEQYLEFKNAVKDFCDVWPGVELDVRQLDSNVGHVVVVVNPVYATAFSDSLSKRIGENDCDSFCMSVDELTSYFNEFSPVFIPHYLKPKSLGQQDMDLLKEKVYNVNRLLKEPSSITSIGVLNAYGQKCLLGSDVKDWNKYEEGTFSEFKYDFDGFDNFLKLLDKDTSYINDLLQKKFYSEVVVYGKHNTKEFPYKIKIYNDVNIIFGDKGSGKSEIIDSLEQHFANGPIRALKYCGGDKDSWFADLLKTDISKHSFAEMDLQNNLLNQFATIKNYSEVNPVSIDEYVKYFSNSSKNEKRKVITFIHQNKINDSSSDTIAEYNNQSKAILKFISSFLEFKIYKDNPKKYEKLLIELDTAYEDSRSLYKSKWVSYYSNHLFDFTLDKINQAVAECIGNPPVPSKTGFYDFASNRIKLMKALKLIEKCLSSNDKIIARDYIGDIGDKGSGYVVEYLRYISTRNIDAIDSKYQNGRKEKYKVFLRYLTSTISSLFDDRFTENVSELQKVVSDNSINNIDYFLSNQKTFTIDSNKYIPSKGEKIILAMQHELISKKEQYSVFLIDEPEAGLGNEYIEKNIVTLIKELAKSGKTIFIATHNANIAVRTLPANTILKTVSNDSYATYQGSMFTNRLVNISNSTDVREWNIESEKHLEGGKEAFEERGYYYADNN